MNVTNLSQLIHHKVFNILNIMAYLSLDLTLKNPSSFGRLVPVEKKGAPLFRREAVQELTHQLWFCVHAEYETLLSVSQISLGQHHYRL